MFLDFVQLLSPLRATVCMRKPPVPEEVDVLSRSVIACRFEFGMMVV